MTHRIDAKAKAAERRARQGRKRLRDWYRSLMDCGEPGLCGDQCRVCRHYAFEEYVGMVAAGMPHSVRYDEDVMRYIKIKTE